MHTYRMKGKRIPRKGYERKLEDRLPRGAAIHEAMKWQGRGRFESLQDDMKSMDLWQGRIGVRCGL